MNQFERQTTKTFRIAIALVFTVFVCGLVGFHFIEGYGFIDSLYMTVLSVSTVGFEVVRPLSPQGKLFVSLLIIFSLGSFAFVGSSIVRFFLDGEFVKKLKTNRVSKRIEKLTDHVIICGYGRNGEQAALELTKFKIQYRLCTAETKEIWILETAVPRVRKNGDSAPIG